MPAPAANPFDQFDEAPAEQAPAAAAPASDANPFDQFDEAPSAPAQAAATPAQPNTWGQAIKNVAQGVGEFATGTVGGLAGDVAGLGALAYDTTANAVLHPFSGSQPSQYADPAAVRERVANFLTYRASNPESVTSKILQAPGRVMSGAGEFMRTGADKIDPSGTLGHVAAAVPLATVSALGIKAGMTPMVKTPAGRVPATGRPLPEAPTPEQLAIKKATDAGYKLTPTQVGNKVGGAVEGVSGQAALERSLSKNNVTITDSLAKKAVGLGDKPINGATLGQARAQANKAYDAIAKTGVRKTSDAYRKDIAAIDDRTGSGSFAEDVPEAVSRLKKIYGSKQAFNSADAVAKIRQLRADARANIKTRDPEKTALGYAQQKVADALDNELGRHVEEIGQADLAANYKAARVQLAKLNTVEQALSGTNVSAKKIWQQWKRGAPLDGELLVIARTYDSFSHVMQEAAKIRQKHPFSVVDALVAAGGAAVNPALVATVAARPLARAALGSKFYQENFVKPRGASAAPATSSNAPPPATVPGKVVPAATAAIRDERRRVRR